MSHIQTGRGVDLVQRVLAAVPALLAFATTRAAGLANPPHSAAF